MKYISMILLLCVLLAGCNSAEAVPPTESSPASTASTPTQLPMEATETTPTESEPAETSPAATVTYTLYLPDGNADGFETVQIETDQITADGILAELQARGVLTETVIINAFGAEGTQLNIDFNRPFGDLVCSMGTSGERMIVGSVVNTFLNAFQAESGYFTGAGESLESGHVIYDFPIAFVE